MDEITLFQTLRQQPPADASLMREAIRARLITTMTGPPAPRRRRGKRLALAGASAAVAAGVVAGTTLASASHPSSHQPRVELAAWTVVKLADGNVYVRIRELRDPAALQSKLRADGVPASVIFPDHPNSACRAYPADTALLKRVFPGSFQVKPPGPGHVIVIHPPAIPGGAGVQLAASFSNPPGYTTVAAPVLVHASPQCTGS